MTGIELREAIKQAVEKVLWKNAVFNTPQETETFDIICDETNNTQADRDARMIHVDIVVPRSWVK